MRIHERNKLMASLIQLKVGTSIKAVFQITNEFRGPIVIRTKTASEQLAVDVTSECYKPCYKLKERYSFEISRNFSRQKMTKTLCFTCREFFSDRTKTLISYTGVLEEQNVPINVGKKIMNYRRYLSRTT